MNSVRVFQVDAFTSQRFSGNPAGVVLDADAIPAEQMRLLARELGSADTAFVLRADAPDHDLRVRFLTPRGESAFIGHATLAVHAVLAASGAAPCPRQKQMNGIVHIDTIAGSSPPRIAIHQPPPPLRAALEASQLSALLDALGLVSSKLDARCPPLVAGESSARVLLGVNDGATLAHLKPDLTRLAQLSGPLGAPGVFLFTLRPEVPEVFTEARMFCPALGIPEDPVSGNAHALLGTYLLQQGLLTDTAQETAPPEDGIATIEFTGAQGHHMDRPGRVTVALAMRAGSLESVSIIGEAVIAFATTVEL